MRIRGDKVRDLAERKGMTLAALLDRAGVSRTAYYSLLRRDSILQASLRAIARELDVSPLDFLQDDTATLRKTRARLELLERILARHPGADRENVWHTLVLLEEEPIERLRRGLTRARRLDFHR